MGEIDTLVTCLLALFLAAFSFAWLLQVGFKITHCLIAFRFFNRVPKFLQLELDAYSYFPNISLVYTATWAQSLALVTWIL